MRSHTFSRLWTGHTWRQVLRLQCEGEGKGVDFSKGKDNTNQWTFYWKRERKKVKVFLKTPRLFPEPPLLLPELHIQFLQWSPLSHHWFGAMWRMHPSANDHPMISGRRWISVIGEWPKLRANITVFLFQCRSSSQFSSSSLVLLVFSTVSISVSTEWRYFLPLIRNTNKNTKYPWTTRQKDQHTASGELTCTVEARLVAILLRFVVTTGAVGPPHILSLTKQKGKWRRY